MRKSTATASADMNWDHLRFLLALAEQGTLSAAARVLGVDHSTVGRRVDSAEAALGVRLFTRSVAGYALSPDGERLLPEMRKVAQAMHGLRRAAEQGEAAVRGPIRVTCPETLGMTWLAKRLAEFALQEPGVQVLLDPSGRVADLGVGEAEIAVRNVRSTQQRLVVQPLAQVEYGLYATSEYLREHPLQPGFAGAHFLAPPVSPVSIEGAWLKRLAPKAEPVLVSELSICLASAAQVSAGIAILPSYLGRSHPGLEHIPVADPPREALWLTVHEDARKVARVRALMAYLRVCFARL